MILIPLGEVARAAMNGEHLVVRQWAADCLRERLTWAALKRPTDLAGDELAIAAGLVEIVAQLAGQSAPPWVAPVPCASRPIYFVPSEMRRSRETSEREGPEPLRRRQIFAMPNYLQLA